MTKFQSAQHLHQLPSEILNQAQRDELMHLASLFPAEKLDAVPMTKTKMLQEFVCGSVHIEGNCYTEQEVHQFLKNKHTAGGKPLYAATMIQHHWEGIIWAMLATPAQVTSPLEVLQMRNRLAEGVHKLPSLQVVEWKILEDMMRAAKSLPNPFDRAIFLHCYISLLSLYDGINCTGRMLQVAALASCGITPLLTLPENLNLYHYALAQFQGAMDYSPYVDLFLDNYRRQTEKLLKQQHMVS
ncbi:hypothetical protein HNP46_005795 [Pseudomonas nitritireducens]|uniref:Fic family protein n=1 Tax=Pseudomonas nitroreducens TaxID=46680 RepID=A0A7W7P3D8_PSENT|nr:hypothetical protein [Pseudomonas nitritireducens]MBB4866888.1 hypothetical protein [Pseudomonas nitritireducens]